MKKSLFILIAILATNLIFAQSKFTNKIVLTTGQKITVESTLNMEASVMSMEINNSTNSTNNLEVKNSTENNYTVSNTITKLKMEISMMGQTKNYDSEKNAEADSELEKEFSGKINTPVDVIVDNSTGFATMKDQKENKKDLDHENPFKNILNAVSGNTDDAVASGAFELIPQGKKIGDKWADSTVSKDIKIIRNYTLKSITGNDAIVEIAITTTASNKLEMQEMEMEMNSITKATSEITTDIKTGLVKKRSVQAEITGNMQVMGQEVPMTATVSSTNSYK